jgi:uncharacterized protein
MPKDRMNRFSKVSSTKLKSYVYALTDPFTKKIFYIGKGTGAVRPFSHLQSKNIRGGDRTSDKIREIRAQGKEPDVEIIRYGLDARSALVVESALIDVLGVDSLTNEIRGHGSRQRGRVRADILNRQLGGKPLNWEGVKVSSILFYAHKAQDQGLNLYDGARGNRAISETRVKARDAEGHLKYWYAFPMNHSEILEIYEILDWFPACTTISSREPKQYKELRWEFIGKHVDDPKLRAYKNRILYRDGKPLPASQKGFRYLTR